MKIYTRHGDGGRTGLLGGRTIDKGAARIETLGDLDELNSSLGVVLGFEPAPSLAACLAQIQDDLFHAGAELAAVEPLRAGVSKLEAEDVERLEAWIDHYDAELEPLRNFILPGGSRAGALLFQTRAVARRAERSLVRLAGQGESSNDVRVQGRGDSPSQAQVPGVRPLLIAYLNRLGDLLFVMARFQNRHDRVSERAWRQETRQEIPASSRLPQSQLDPS